MTGEPESLCQLSTDRTEGDDESFLVTWGFQVPGRQAPRKLLPVSHLRSIRRGRLAVVPKGGPLHPRLKRFRSRKLPLLDGGLPNRCEGVRVLQQVVIGRDGQSFIASLPARLF